MQEIHLFYKILLILLPKSSPPFLVYYGTGLLSYSDLLAVFYFVTDSARLLCLCIVVHNV